MLSVTFLGTGAACPTIDRNVAGLALAREGETLLFDCGEGTQRQMMRYGVSFAFTEVFFSHWHADHFLGITGLIRTLGLLDRTAPMTLFGPKGAERILGQAVSLGFEKPRFKVEIVELKAGDVFKRDEYELHVVAADHRTDCVGYALVEHIRLGRFDPDRARELGVPEGPLGGKPRPGRRVVYSGDTRPCATMLEAARGADLLIHEATFGDDEQDRARETGHSTARQAAELAAMAGAHRLALTHLSARYSREAPELLAEAQAALGETVVARDGMKIEVPFRDR